MKKRIFKKKANRVCKALKVKRGILILRNRGWFMEIPLIDTPLKYFNLANNLNIRLGYGIIFG